MPQAPGETGPRRLRLILATPPGRLPTVVHDPGAWWRSFSTEAFHRTRISHAHAWWKWIASPSAAQLASDDVGRLELSRTGDAAQAALSALEAPSTYGSAAEYVNAVRELTLHLKALNTMQSDLLVSLAEGPILAQVDYRDSRDIVRAARAQTPLSDGIKASLAGVPDADLVFVTATSEYDLLSAAIIAVQWKTLNPGLHVCLVDHGYENFSLTPFLPSLDRGGDGLLGVFDTLIASKNDVDAATQDLVDRVARCEVVQGVLTGDAASVRVGRPLSPAPYSTADLVPTFSPTPVLHTRLSTGSCYWGTCTFCTQNSKFSGAKGASKSDVGPTLDRLSSLKRLGVDHVIFTDEALSPSILLSLSRAMSERGLGLKWACRCKVEDAFDHDTFAAAAEAGCREILIGVETTSGRLLDRMGKGVSGRADEGLDAMLHRIEACGISIHVNLINGFPTETVVEAQATVEAVIDHLADAASATVLLNPFTVFPATPIAYEPWRFGIAQLQASGDMPSRFDVWFEPEVERRTAPARDARARLAGALLDGLGWGPLLATGGGSEALELYSTSGHSLVFKAGPHNALDSLRRPPARTPARQPRRRHAFITGGAGMVGVRVAEGLLERGWAVTALVRQADAQLPPGCERMIGDLLDAPGLEDALGGSDLIVHCASPRSLVREVMLLGDVQATGLLLEAWSSGTLVYMSSQTVYGEPTGLLSETTPCEPHNWYDIAKLTNENQLAAHCVRTGAAGVSLRLPLVFSPDPLGQGRDFLAGLVAVLVKGEPLLVSAESDLDTHGSVFIGGEDVAAAVAAASTFDEGGVFNIASGFTTWRGLIDLFSAHLGVVPNVVRDVDAGVGCGGIRLPRSRTTYDVSRFTRSAGQWSGAPLEAVIGDYISRTERPVSRTTTLTTPSHGAVTKA